MRMRMSKRDKKLCEILERPLVYKPAEVKAGDTLYFVVNREVVAATVEEVLDERAARMNAFLRNGWGSSALETSHPMVKVRFEGGTGVWYYASESFLHSKEEAHSELTQTLKRLELQEKAHDNIAKLTDSELCILWQNKSNEKEYALMARNEIVERFISRADNASGQNEA